MSLLLLFSCNSIPSSKSSYLWKDILILGDSSKKLKGTLQQIELYGKKDFISSIRQIEVSPRFCHAGQVACMTPTRRGVVYLNLDFFSLHPFEKMGSLVHEAAHFIYGHQHVPCTSPHINNRDCDNDLESAFGRELLFYRQLVELLVDEDQLEILTSLIEKTKVRINIPQ